MKSKNIYFVAIGIKKAKGGIGKCFNYGRYGTYDDALKTFETLLKDKKTSNYFNLRSNQKICVWIDKYTIGEKVDDYVKEKVAFID